MFQISLFTKDFHLKYATLNSKHDSCVRAEDGRREALTLDPTRCFPEAQLSPKDHPPDIFHSPLECFQPKHRKQRETEAQRVDATCQLSRKHHLGVFSPVLSTGASCPPPADASTSLPKPKTYIWKAACLGHPQLCQTPYLVPAQAPAQMLRGLPSAHFQRCLHS